MIFLVAVVFDTAMLRMHVVGCQVRMSKKTSPGAQAPNIIIEENKPCLFLCGFKLLDQDDIDPETCFHKLP